MNLTHQEIADSDQSLSELKHKIRELREAMYDPKTLCEIFEEMENSLQHVAKPVAVDPSTEASFAEMKKLDENLKKKIEEEREIRLSRMHDEEETRGVLYELCTGDAPDALRHNSEQFLKLVSGFDSNCSIAAETPESLPDGDNRPKKEKHSKNRTGKHVTKIAPFIERNKLLAKCGHGVLSITDEEKLRLQTILVDLESGSKHDTTISDISISNIDFDSTLSSVSNDNLYVLNEDCKEILDRIDRKLKVYEEIKNHGAVPDLQIIGNESNVVITESTCQTEKKDDSDKGEKKKQQVKDDSYRLKEVDKLIFTVTSASKEDISPLSEEDIQSLIEEAQRCLIAVPKIVTEESEHDTTLADTIELLYEPAPSHETIEELIDAAKSLMPNFKYRFTNA